MWNMTAHRSYLVMRPNAKHGGLRRREIGGNASASSNLILTDNEAFSSPSPVPTHDQIEVFS